jgi:predicted dehydrogenase
VSDPRICIVGAGNLSTRRIYPYIGAAGAQLVGVCDLDVDKARRNARRFGGTAYRDMAEMLEAEKPDGVILCIGPEAHAELAPVVMRRGIAVYTEKPPALTAADALAVARVSAETGVLCTTAFKKRYNVAYSRARQWLDGFPADRRESISVDYASARYADREGRSSFLLDFAIHAIDLVRYLFGEVTQAFSFTKDAHSYAVSLRFDHGGVGTMNLTDGRSFVVPTEEVEITVAGGNFMTVHNSSCWRITQDQKCVEWRQPPTFVSGGDSGNETGHLAEIVDFLAAIRQRRTTRSNIYESYRSMVLYEAVAESARTGQVVPLAYETLEG